MLIFLLTGGISVHGQDTIDVISVDASQFPNIRVSFLPVQGGQPLETLSASQVTISEEFQAGSLDVQSFPDRPTVFGLVIETSDGAEFTQIREAARAFLRDVYQDGDTLYLFLNSNTGILMASRSEAETFLGNIEPSQRSLAATLANARTELLSEKADDPSVNRQLILLGSLVFDIRDLETSSIARSFRDSNIPIYSVQLRDRDERGSSTKYFQDLGELSGGQFADLEGSSSIGSDLQPMFAAMNQNRNRYELSYITTSQNPNPERTVSVTINEVSASFNYEPQFQDPIVTIVDTNTRPARNIDASGQYSPTEQTVNVRVSFPDGISRAISTLTLEVIDAVNLYTNIANNPRLDANGNYSIKWDLAGYSVPNSKTPITVVVKVVDQLGRTGSAEQNGEVEVDQIPPTLVPSVTPTSTSTPTPTDTLTPTVTPPPVIDIGLGDPITTDDARNIFWLNLLLLVITIGVAGVAIFLLFTRRGRQMVVSAASATSTAIVRTEVYKRATEIFGVSSAAPVGGNSGGGARNKPIAFLYPRRGVNDLTPIPIERKQFSFGREASLCDYAIRERFISAEHFRITQQGNSFTLTDMNSANGTYVNDVLIKNDSVPLPAGAIIRIVELELEFHPEGMAPATEVIGMGKPSSSPTELVQTPYASPDDPTYQMPYQTPSIPSPRPLPDDSIDDDLFDPQRRNSGIGPRDMFGDPEEGDDEQDIGSDWGDRFRS